MDRVDFPQWIVEQRTKRGWSQSDLARAADISRQVVSDYEGYKRKYFDDDVLIKIANALKLPPEEVFRAAGILPPVPAKTAQVSKLDHLIAQLPEEDIEDLYALVKAKVERIEEKEKEKRAAAKKRLPAAAASKA